MHTNNGVEAQNKLLKYTYLPRRKNITLSEVLTIIIDVYLPDSYQKYLMKNYQMSETYRTYKDFVPDYLRGRPRGVIIHCLQRMEKGKKFDKSDITEDADEIGLFHVTSQSGRVHHVNFGAATGTPTCTCKDWIHFRIPCKHFFAIFNHSKDWKWGSLPNHYLESSHITADTKALDAVCPTIADNLPDHPLDLVCSDDDSLAIHEEWSDQEHGPNTTMLIATDSSTSASPSSPQIKVSMCIVHACVCDGTIMCVMHTYMHVHHNLRMCITMTMHNCSYPT